VWNLFYQSTHAITGQQKKSIEDRVLKIKHKGPDATRIRYYNSNVMIRVNRLALETGCITTEDGKGPDATRIRYYNSNVMIRVNRLALETGCITTEDGREWDGV
jgi:hypothetical protein